MKAKIRMSIKQWIELIDNFIYSKGKRPISWDTVLIKEHSSGATFFNTIEDTKPYPNTYAGKWFKSKQTWLDFYNSYDYIYSLLFGQRIVSHFCYTYTYIDIAKRYGTKFPIVDVGGAAFTAFQLIQLGAPKVYVENFDNSPQSLFTTYMAEQLSLPIEVIKHNEFPKKSIMICSEYLEHFKNVDEEVDRLVEGKPKAIYERSAFGTPAYGHYIPITINRKLLNETSARHNGRKQLRKYFESLGYNRTIVDGFNKRPFLFVKEKL